MDPLLLLLASLQAQTQNKNIYTCVHVHRNRITHPAQPGYPDESSETLGAYSLSQQAAFGDHENSVYCVACDASGLGSSIEDTMLYAASDGYQAAFPLRMVCSGCSPAGLHIHLAK